MAAVSRAQLLKELLPGLNSIFGDEYKTYPDEHTQVYKTESSERSFEEDLKIGDMGAAAVKPEGQAVQYDGGQEAWSARFTHETIALAFAITQEAMEDNLYADLGKRYSKLLARSMAHTKQVKSVVPLNDGFTSYTTGDGVYLFSTSHPLLSGGTNANRPAVGADLNETSLENAAIDIQGWLTERGLKVMANPRKLIIPRQLAFVATRLLKTELRIATADNDVNALKAMSTVPEGYAVNHWLTDTNAWFLTTDVPNGLKHFQRVGIENSMDGDFDTGNVRYKARERYSFGVSDPLGIYGSPGAS